MNYASDPAAEGNVCGGRGSIRVTTVVAGIVCILPLFVIVGFTATWYQCRVLWFVCTISQWCLVSV